MYSLAVSRMYIIYSNYTDHPSLIPLPASPISPIHLSIFKFFWLVVFVTHWVYLTGSLSWAWQWRERYTRACGDSLVGKDSEDSDSLHKHPQLEQSGEGERPKDPLPTPETRCKGPVPCRLSKDNFNCYVWESVNYAMPRLSFTTLFPVIRLVHLFHLLFHNVPEF
jgi:hypothetical protein